VKRVLLMAAALVAAVVVFALVSLPGRPISLDTAWRDGSVAGVIHVHTTRSDGGGSPEEVAAAAARAGLAFIVLTDHGDATRPPDPPVYRSGVLCLDGVEVSTSGGHYVAIDMPAAPYPLAGEPRDVVEDVQRLGGFGVAAQPDSPKRELQWSGWSAPFDGVELINPDSSWRAHAADPDWQPKFRLVRALTTYPFRGAATIAGLLKDSPETIRHWDALTADRRVVGLAGIDAHARLALQTSDPGESRFALPVPGYEVSFRVLSVRVHPDRPLTGDAADDARSIVGGLRRGRLYTAIDGWAGPPAFEMTARNGAGTAVAGDELAVADAVTVRVRSNAPSSFTTMLWKGAEAVATSRGGALLEWTGPAAPGVYRAEIRAGDRPDGPPWIIGNPIYVRDRVPARTAVPPPTPTVARPLFDGTTTNGWTHEADETSMAVIEVAGRLEGSELRSELRLRYGLSGGPDIGQFAATSVATTGGVAMYDRISFTIRAERPMRVSVQLRAAIDGGEPERWHRSIYVEPHDVQRAIMFSDMMPLGRTSTPAVPAAAVRDVLFVVDTVNTAPGASGQIWLRNVRLEK
jgi:hypothetical protein